MQGEARQGEGLQVEDPILLVGLEASWGPACPARPCVGESYNTLRREEAEREGDQPKRGDPEVRGGEP